MRRIGQVVAVCVSLIGITGCALFPTGENYSWGDVNAEVTVSDDGATGKLNGSISIDAKITEPANAVWKEYNVSQLTMTKDEFDTIAKSLISNNTITNIKNYEGSYYSCDYSDGSSYTYNFQDDGIFSIIYNTAKNINAQYSSVIESSNGVILSVEDVKEMLPNDELDDFAKSDAIKMAKDICAKMNIEVSDTPYLCAAMDYENVNKAIDQDTRRGMNKYGEVKYWTKSDEAYYIIFQQQMDNVPVTTSSKVANFYMIPDTSVAVVVGKDGVLKVENHGLYSVNSSENASVIDSKKAINVLATDSLYAAIGNMTLTDLSLEYAVYCDLKTNEITIKPMWVYVLERQTTTEKNGETYVKVSRQTGFIDAVTGKVLGG